MKRRKFLTTYILIGLLVILVLIWLGVRFKRQQQQAQQQQTVAFYENLNPDEISKIEIINNQETTTLIKEEDKWYELIDSESETEKQEINAEAIKTAINKVKDLKVGEPITTNPDKQDLFKVNANGTQIKFYQQDQEVVNFYIGKATSDFMGVYIRKQDDNKIYEIKDRINIYFHKSSYQKSNSEKKQE